MSDGHNIPPDSQPSAEVARGGELPPLRRDRRLLGWAAGHGVSDVGDHVFHVALVYTAAQIASPGMASLIIAAAVAPRAVLSLFAGAMVDRADPRRVMVASNLGQILVLIAAIAVLLAQGPSVALLLALGASFGIASAFHGPAAITFPRQLRPLDELTQVAGIRQLVSRAASIAGPPLGGILLAVGGLTGALTVDAASFAVIVVVLLCTRPRWSLARQRDRSLLASVRGGLSYVGGTPEVRDLVVALSGLNVFVTPVTAVGLALRAAEEGWSAPALGSLMGAIGAAAALGTVVTMTWRPTRPILTALLLLLAQAAALAAVGFAPYSGVLMAMLVVGLTAGLASPYLVGTFQATVDEAYLGRTGSVLTLADDALTPVAMASFGAIVELSNLAIACAGYSGAFIFLLLYSLSRPHLRARPPHRPPPVSKEPVADDHDPHPQT